MAEEPPVEVLESEPVPPDERQRAEAAVRARAIEQRDVRRAWMIALAADAVQWVFFPLFLTGAAGPWNVALDLVVALAMIRLLGFHLAFAPAFVTELIPIANFVPTWTLAVWIATRGRGG